MHTFIHLIYAYFCSIWQESRDKQFLLGRLTELGGAGQNKKNDKEKKQESKSDSKSNGQTSYNSMEETEPLSKHLWYQTVRP